MYSFRRAQAVVERGLLDKPSESNWSWWTFWVKPAGGTLCSHVINQMTLYLGWHGITGAETLKPAEWKSINTVCALNTVKLSKRPKPAAYFPLPFPFSQLDSLSNQCFTCWLTHPAAGWRSFGVVLHWGRRAELGGNSVQTGAGSAAWCSPELTGCCWPRDPPCCGRH